MEDVLEVFGKATWKLFLVQWEGYPPGARFLGARRLTHSRRLHRGNKRVLGKDRKKPSTKLLCGPRRRRGDAMLDVWVEKR